MSRVAKPVLPLNVVPDLSQFAHAPALCADIDDFYKRFRSVDSGYSIAFDDCCLDIEIKARASDTVIFFFTGAVDRHKVLQPPVFNFRSVSKNTDASCVFISDPSLYLSDMLTLGWYAGCRGVALQRILPGLLDFIRMRLGGKKALFFGGSGGGFAAMFYARFIPDTLALVWNPQIDITRYYPGHVRTYAQTAFGADKESLPEHIITDLASFYRRHHGNNRIIYIQSASDRHTDVHLRPFAAARGLDMTDDVFSGWLADDFYLHLTNWSAGHTAPPRPVLLHLVETMGHKGAVWDADSIQQMMCAAENLTQSPK